MTVMRVGRLLVKVGLPGRAQLAVAASGTGLAGASQAGLKR